MDLPVLDILYKWNHTICGLLFAPLCHLKYFLPHCVTFIFKTEEKVSKGKEGNWWFLGPKNPLPAGGDRSQQTVSSQGLASRPPLSISVPSLSVNWGDKWSPHYYVNLSEQWLTASDLNSSRRVIKV